MCLAVPARVVEIGESSAVVEIGGVRREASLILLDGVTVGQWVIVHAGFAIAALDPEEAEKTLSLLKEIAEA